MYLYKVELQTKNPDIAKFIREWAKAAINASHEQQLSNLIIKIDDRVKEKVVSI